LRTALSLKACSSNQLRTKNGAPIHVGGLGLGYLPP